MTTCILQDMKEILIYLPSGLLCGLAFFVAAFLVTMKIKKKKNCQTSPFIRILFCSLFLSYLVILIQIVLLSREPGTRLDVNLRLGGTWVDDPQGRAYVIENILLFIPLGTLLPFCMRTRIKSWHILLIGLLSSSCIECIQHITGRGYFQVDDIVTNGFGSIIGYGIYFICCAIFSSF